MCDLQEKDFKIENLTNRAQKSLTSIRESMTSQLKDLQATPTSKPKTYLTQQKPNFVEGNLRGNSGQSLESDREEKLCQSDIG